MSVTLSDTTVLETPRLILRAPCAGDVAPFVAFLRSDRAGFVGGPVDAAKAWRATGHFIGHWVMRGFGMFVAVRRDTGAPVGTAGPWFPEGWAEPEIGWTIWSGADEGQGYAAEAARAALGFAYDTLGWTTAISYIDPDNARSRALARRLGCVIDADVAPPSDAPCIVYRHPGPEHRP